MDSVRPWCARGVGWPCVGLVAMLCLLVAAGGVAGQSEPATGVVRPQRLVHQFDFEDTDDRGQKLGYGHQWPRHWYVIGRSPKTSDPNFLRQPLHQQLIERRGYPTFTEVRFDDRYATSGTFSFFLGLDGGSAGAFLEVGALPAVPGSDYLVSANVRTEHLDRAVARITAYFVDDQGRRVDGSVSRSDPIRTGGEWTTVAVKLPGTFAEAAWIGLELELLQPTPAAGHPLGAQQIVLEDVDGAAWFDDIRIWQVPHVEVATQSRVNIVRAPQRPQVFARVRDLTGRALVADLVIYDHALREVDRAQYQVGMGAPPRWKWTPELPALGWYLIDMTVRDRDPAEAAGIGGLMLGGSGATGSGASGSAAAAAPATPIARTLGAFLWLPPGHALHPTDAGRFALVAEAMPDEQLDLLPEVLEAALIDRAVLSIWTRRTTRETLDARLERLEELLQGVLTSGREVSLSLHPVPAALAEASGVGQHAPLELLTADPRLWRPFLAPVLMRHSQRVRQWQLGTTALPPAFFDADLPSVMATVEAQFRALAPSPQLVLPWRLDQAYRADLPASLAYAIDVPPGIVPRHLPDYLSEWREAEASCWLHLREPPATELAHRHRVTDLALRMVHAWRTDPAGLAIAQPWTPAVERREAMLPDPLLGVFTNVARLLSGRRVVGPLSLGPGLACLVLDGPAGGMLVAWNVDAPPEEAHLHMYLGERPVAIDVWGNAEPVPLVDRRHRLSLGESPVFITGIDPELALFRASFTVQPPLIESMQVPHPRTITLRNPWPRTISGHLQVLGPKDWTIQPSRHFFSIAAGRAIELPVQIQFPIAEVAGAKKLTARFDFTADQHYVVEMSAPMELGLPDVEFEATVALQPGEEPGTYDAVVSCIITNKGEATRALYVFANLVNHPRQERIIARLEPGQSVVRRFRFEDAADDIRRHPVRAGVRETNGPAILNKLLTPDRVRGR